MRAGILLALVLHTALLSPAETIYPSSSTRSLSLRECVDLALSRNLDIRIVHLSADIATYDLRGAYGVYSPLFTFSAHIITSISPAIMTPKKPVRTCPTSSTMTRSVRA